MSGKNLLRLVWLILKLSRNVHTMNIGYTWIVHENLFNILLCLVHDIKSWNWGNAPANKKTNHRTLTSSHMCKFSYFSFYIRTRENISYSSFKI